MSSRASAPAPLAPPDRATFDALWLADDLAARIGQLTPGRTLRPGATLRAALRPAGAGEATGAAAGPGDDADDSDDGGDGDGAELLADASPVETITPPPEEGPPDSAADAALEARLQTLPRLLQSADGAAPPELTLGRTIGEGGMGVVRLARQLALGREVAVKSLRPAARHPATMRRLLAEAMVAGALEHPDILPIHALGRDETGAPLLVLKRVDGVSWAEVARAPGHPLVEGQDPLAWHLQVLMRVCRAVHFAHERGILHRDLKTDNVMIGRHGEVYVLDWGIAVALRDDGSGAIPLAAAADELVGTPAAMAPEMVEAKGALLSPRTDVFLLGAMLHELLVGRPRHAGREVAAVLFAAFLAEPCTYPPEVPAELAAIANRACARAAADRFESADALRKALLGYLQHRSSTQLVASAEDRLREYGEALLRARAALATAAAAAHAAAVASRRRAPDDTEATLEALQQPEVAATRLELERLAGAARASLQEAARAWADNPAVPRLERRMRLEQAGWQLDCLDVAATAASLGGLDEPEALALAPALARARAALSDHQRRVQRRRDDADPTIGARTRSFLALALGAGFFVAPATGAVAQSFFGWQPTRGSLLAGGLAFLGLVGVAAVWARQSMFRTRLNRSVLIAGAVCALAVTFERLMAFRLGLAVDAVVAFDQFTFGLTMAMMAAGAWPRLWLASLVYFTGAVVTVASPGAGLWALATANLVAMVLVAFHWRSAEYDEHRLVRVLATEVR